MPPVRSSFESISGEARKNLRDGAVARAWQGLPQQMTVANMGNYQPGRAGHEGESGAPAGTYNGPGPGTSAHDGVELMANVIRNGMQARNAQAARGSAPPIKPRKAI